MFLRDRQQQQRRATAKAEANLEWLGAQVELLAGLLATRRSDALLPEGDYSDAQLERVHRQCMVLREYYALLDEAIVGADFYCVYDVASRAGMVLGRKHAVHHSTVRRWSAEFIAGQGQLKPDERGHYTRELLVMEEDVNNAFVKWSLGKAKKDDLSCEEARDYLNGTLLAALPAGILSDYAISLPISLATTKRWMHACSIHRYKRVRRGALLCCVVFVVSIVLVPEPIHSSKRLTYIHTEQEPNVTGPLSRNPTTMTSTRTRRYWPTAPSTSS